MTRERTADVFAGTIPMFGWPVGEPHIWFAWKPVHTFDGRTVWLRRVFRQLVAKHSYLDGGSDCWFRYAVAESTALSGQT
jgi:hypothetical protein